MKTLFFIYNFKQSVRKYAVTLIYISLLNGNVVTEMTFQTTEDPQNTIFWDIGLLFRWKSIDDSEDHIASIFRVEA
jgi:hypothetical protein